MDNITLEVLGEIVFPSHVYSFQQLTAYAHAKHAHKDIDPKMERHVLNCERCQDDLDLIFSAYFTFSPQAP